MPINADAHCCTAVSVPCWYTAVITVSVVAKLRAARAMSLGSIPNMRKIIVSLPKSQDPLWGPLSLLDNGYRGFFHDGKAAGA